MNARPKHELQIDIVGFLIALAGFGYENLDLPHSKAVGIASWFLCLLVAVRVAVIWSKNRINITFKHSSDITWWRRQVITHDIAGMHKYFASLEIPVPETIPPLTVHEEGQAIFTPPHMYRGELRIPRPQITNRKVVTHIYAVHVMLSAFPDPTKSPAFWDSLPASADQLHQITFFSAELREYLHASYWNSFEADGFAGTAALILWKIREAFGRRFGDRLASKVFLVAVDSLAEISNPDMNVSFAKKLKIANGILEAYQQSWPKIQKILDDNRVIAKFTFVPSNPNQ
jgi:hypothetical protein